MGFIELGFLNHVCYNELNKKRYSEDSNNKNDKSDEDSPLDNAINFYTTCLIGTVGALVILMIILIIFV